ncbi:hypothetical protein GO730_03180 [Spirosoma sp. HMF3257]|uniref:Aerotolerance regulator N-terminal domain-containing protein n=1 Tax=Spirosoma telluris TaxID=2183553 RepID=A0A327NEB4_9BACT|nr:hypothetical protein [Spirosoma telluris]RAI73661.1 hypothetical protein HMF3257_03105 [Spirosoma telluris]
MHTTLNWTTPISWLIALALLALLVVQLWFIVRSESLSNSRKWIRVGLNGLLWFVLVGYFLQIQWPISRPTTHALLLGDEVPGAVARHLKDSLHIQESFSSRNFKATYDSITLVGQQFPTETLTQLSNAELQWIPYSQSDQLQDIHWKGIVRQGELQSITGQLQSSKKQLLRVRFGTKTLDSLALQEGANTFRFQFPTFARGHSQAELVLGTTTLDTLHFFTRPTDPLTIQFLLNSPDFESKTLADWLGKQGYTVTVSATLSKDISSQISINKKGKSAGKAAPDLIITEPVNAANTVVKKAIADGKSVLFINLTNPETDCRTINQALGSRWQVRKVNNEPLIPLGNGLNALPYRFVDSPNQFSVTGYPIAAQQMTGRVGVSLLSETYPLSLSGDSVTYNRVWTAVLARLSESDHNTIQVDAPVYSGIRHAISINNPTNRLTTLRVGQDTLRLSYSPINDRSAVGTSSFSKPGWQSVQDSLALYVNPRNSNDPIADRVLLSRFMLAHTLSSSIEGNADRTTTAQLPNWAWFVLLLACFTALWVEPKLG